LWLAVLAGLDNELKGFIEEKTVSSTGTN